MCIRQHDVEWLSELQPVLRKDGNTIAWAMRQIVEEICETLRGGLAQRGGSKAAHPRLIHIVLGDGVNTNDNAARRLLRHF